MNTPISLCQASARSLDGFLLLSSWKDFFTTVAALGLAFHFEGSNLSAEPCAPVEVLGEDVPPQWQAVE